MFSLGIIIIIIIIIISNYATTRSTPVVCWQYKSIMPQKGSEFDTDRCN
jgi:hypothetical protein